MKAHNDGQASRFGPIEFGPMTVTEMDGAKFTYPTPRCSYCGSLAIDDAIKAFQTPGVHWSGSDWKYGWPHKFYLDIPCEPRRKCTSKGLGDNDLGYSEVHLEHCKFYTEHLIDASPEQLAEWNRVVKPITGIGFEIENGERLKWNAPQGGWQQHGIISEDSRV